MDHKSDKQCQINDKCGLMLFDKLKIYKGEKNMAENFEEKNENIFKIWIENYITVSKIWEDSYLKMYKLWLESTGELFQKAVDISRDATNEEQLKLLPDKYKEFYDEWLKTYQSNTGKFYQTPKSNKEIFEKFLIGAEESNKIYRSWIAELEENSSKTREALKEEENPTKYKDIYDMWIKSYGNIFDDLLTLPFRSNIKEIFESYTGTPDIYSDAVMQISKLWKDSYAKLYAPQFEPIQRLYEKSLEISSGNASTENYKEFYNLWMNTYQKNYNRLFDIQSEKPSKEIFENFVQNTDVYLSLYKSWTSALEKLSLKAKEISQKTVDPAAYNEFYSLWAKTYEKAFDSFFENAPTVGPFKQIFEPAKNIAKIYADSFAKISEIWIKSYPGIKEE